MNLLKKTASPWLWLAVFFLPWLPKVLFGLPWLMLQNFTDGVFYLGYAMQFQELIDRVGMNYYAVRFSGIFPDALAFSIFGLEVGLVLVRYGLAGACCVALFACFQKRYSTAAGVLAALAWAMNPAAIRVLQTAYVDVTASSFLCIGLALACLPGLGALAAAGAGALFSFAFWGHLHAAVALVFSGPLLVVALWEGGSKRALVLMGWMFLGFLVPTVAAAVFYLQYFGLWDLTSPTRELLQTLKDGHIPAPKLEWIEVVRQCPFWLSVLPLAAGLFFLPKRDRFLRASFFAFAGYIVFLLWGDLAKGGYSLSLFYYFSFALPAYVFLVAALVSNLGRDIWRMAWALLLPVFAVAWNSEGGSWAMAGVIVLACLPAFFVWQRSSAALAVCLAVASLAVALAPSSKLALGNYWKSDDLPLLAMAGQLSKALPKYQDDPGKLVFWYDDSKGDDLRMLQSFYLHEFTKLKTPDGGGLPSAPGTLVDENSILRAGVRHVVVLGFSAESIEPMVQTLRDSGVPLRGITPVPLHSGGHTLHATLVSFAPPEIHEKSSVEPQWRLYRRARMTKKGTSARFLETSPKKGRLDAALPVPPLAAGEAVLVRIRAMEGSALVGLATNDSVPLDSGAAHVSSTKFPQEILLFPPNPGEPSSLQIRNAAPRGVRSKILIKEVKTVLLSKPSASSDIDETESRP